ncbi:MAG: DNA topoisomerase (ATP-hydrolyzing) subunit A, partial [Enterococcus casseliflavus]|nr:DNA topoisomerase (ATP-hydrolyzing) subunit A [Enterococcus casseliflavus]
VGLKRILESYIKHRREVIEKRSRFELQKAQKRQHIVDGLIKALSILDEVIATIRGSKDKKDAKNNLVVQHGFTEEQAEAIVNLQLYRLTNTDITQLQAEAKELAETIAELTTILNEENELLKVIKKELREIKKKYTTPRLTEIEAEIQEIKIETQVLVAQEEVVVTVTRDGYVKRSSLRSYGASKPEEIGMKEGDSLLYSNQMNTLDHLLLVTNKGNTIYRPVHELPDLKWKDLGEHISQTVMTLAQDEMIIGVFAYKEIDPLKNFVLISKNGMIKQTRMTEFEPWRTYKTRPMTIMKLKDESDELVNVFLTDQTEEMDVFLVSHLAFGLRYPLNEVPVVGPKAAGVKAMNLKADDYLINGLLVYSEGDTPIVLITQRGAAKRMLAQEINQLGRAKRGLMVLRELKKNPHRVVYMGSGENQQLLVTNQKGQSFEVITNQIPINDRTSNGSFIMDEKTGGQIYEVKTQISPAIAEDSVL